MSAPGLNNMMIGGAICVVGLIVTVVSASSGGNRFVFAWGAILFGGFQLVRGLIAFLNYSPPGETEPGSSRPAVAAPPQLRPIASFPEPARIMIEALSGAIRHPSQPTPQELAAIRSVLAATLNAVVSDADLVAAAKERGQSAEGMVPFIEKRKSLLDLQMRQAILRGCFLVLMASGPRPYAMPAVLSLGKAMGLEEAPVRQIVADLTGSLDGAPREVLVRLDSKRAEDGGAIELRYSALMECSACRGIGGECKRCNDDGRVPVEQTLTIKLPDKLKTGDRLKCDGRGDAPMSGGRPGDLFIRIVVDEARPSA
ncbi:MAG: molecular chaperone DnaJ [Hyphomicrobiales bacterium]|nr:molecular chaperone DnaJ [Hyphomicrobiales bacterium]